MSDKYEIVFKFNEGRSGTTASHVQKNEHEKTMCGLSITADWYGDEWGDGPECKKCLSIHKGELNSKETLRLLESDVSTSTSEYYPGSVVRIYHDPITKQDPEGLAELLSLERSGGGFQWWNVRFVEDGRETIRKIHEDQS